MYSCTSTCPHDKHVTGKYFILLTILYVSEVQVIRQLLQDLRHVADGPMSSAKSRSVNHLTSKTGQFTPFLMLKSVTTTKRKVTGSVTDIYIDQVSLWLSLFLMQQLEFQYDNLKTFIYLFGMLYSNLPQ